MSLHPDIKLFAESCYELAKARVYPVADDDSLPRELILNAKEAFNKQLYFSCMNNAAAALQHQFGHDNLSYKRIQALIDSFIDEAQEV